MATNYWDEDEDEVTPAQDETTLLKQMRKKIREDEKRMKELQDKLDNFSKAEKESVIKRVLESNGVSPKAARFIAKEIDGDITEDSVYKFLEDNAEAFGLEVQYKEQPQQTIDRAALRQQDIVTQQAVTPDRAEDALMRLNEAASAEEIINMIQSGNF